MKIWASSILFVAFSIQAQVAVGPKNTRIVDTWSELATLKPIATQPYVQVMDRGGAILKWTAGGVSNSPADIAYSTNGAWKLETNLWDGDVRAFGHEPDEVLTQTYTATTSLIVDALTHPSTYNHDSGFAYFDGYWWLGWNGADSRYGTVAAEGLSGQEIYFLKGTDWNSYGTVSNAYFAPWTSATYSSNPLSVDTTRVEWHPNFWTMGGSLWCSWYTTHSTFTSNQLHGSWISKLTDEAAKWTIYKASFYDTGEATLRSTSLETHNATDAISIGGNDYWPAFTVQPYQDGNYVVQTFSAIRKAYSGNYLPGVLWTTNAGTSWEWSVVPQTEQGLGPAYRGWEPWVVKALDGRWVMVYRSFTPRLGETYGVTYSADLKSWTTPVNSSIEALPQRGTSLKLSPGLWGLILGDRQYPVGASDSQVGIRQNMALWLSVDGLNWAPGTSLSSVGERADYGAMFEKDGYLYYSYSARDPRGIAVGRIQKPQGIVPWVAPRDSADVSLDTLPMDGGDYIDFAPQANLESTVAATNTGTGMTMAWFGKPYDITCATVDWRSAGYVGPLTYSDGNTTLNSILVTPPVADIVRTYDGFMYMGLSLDETNDEARVYIRTTGNSWSNKTVYAKRVRINAQPGDTETVTLNGITYTFKTSAGAAPEVEIGSSFFFTLNNLRTVVDAYDSTVSLPSSPLLEGGTNYSIWLFKSSAHGTTTPLVGKIDVPSETWIADTNTVWLGPFDRANTSARRFRGKVYDFGFFDYGLSEDDHQALFNAYSATHGLATETTASSLAWSNAQLRLNPSSYDSAVWQPLPDYRNTATWSSGDLMVRGDGGGSVATPAGNWTFHTQWKAGNPTNRIILAEIGAISNRVTIIATNDSGWKVLMSGMTNSIQAILSPTNWNNLSIAWIDGRVYVGGAVAKKDVASKLYLGRGYFEDDFLGRSTEEITTFRISKASVSRFDKPVAGYTELDSGIAMQNITDYPLEEFEIAGAQPKLKLTDTDTASSYYLTVSSGGTLYYNNDGVLDQDDSPFWMTQTTPEMVLNGTSPTMTLRGGTSSILSFQNEDGTGDGTTDVNDVLGSIYASGVVSNSLQGAKGEIRFVATSTWTNATAGTMIEFYGTHASTNGRTIILRLSQTTGANRSGLFIPIAGGTPRQVGITNNGTVDLLYLLP